MNERHEGLMADYLARKDELAVAEEHLKTHQGAVDLARERVMETMSLTWPVDSKVVHEGRVSRVHRHHDEGAITIITDQGEPAFLKVSPSTIAPLSGKEPDGTSVCDTLLGRGEVGVVASSNYGVESAFLARTALRCAGAGKKVFFVSMRDRARTIMQGIFSDPDATSNDFNPILGQDIIVLPYDDPDMKRAIERVSTDIATLVADGPRPDVILFDAPSEGLLPHVGRGERVVELRRLAGETGAVVVLHLKANVSGDDVDVAVLKNADAAWLLHSGGTAACLKAREPKPTVAPPSERIGTGRADVDRDIDGGVERGQTILVAGMPDSGKTEFLLEVAAKNLAAARRVLFVTKNGVADTHARLEAAMFKAVAVPREYQDEARALLLKGWSALFSSDETDFFEVKMALSEKRVDVVIVDDLDVIFDHADGFNGARRGIARVSGLFVEACREHGVVGVASTSIMGSFNGTPSADQDDGKAGPVSTFDVDLMVFKEGPDVCVRALADRRRRVEETPVRDELPQPSSRASAVDEVEPGEIAIAVGLSGFGKTEWLVEVATRFMEKKRFVLFVSMFDKPKAIMKRLDEVSEERGLDEEARAHCLVLSHISFEEMRFEVSTMNSPPDVIIVDGVDVMSRSDYDAGFVAGWCRDLRTTFIASTSDALRQGPWESNATFVVDISDQGFGKVVKSKTGKP